VGAKPPDNWNKLIKKKGLENLQTEKGPNQWLGKAK
jgi:hypothetical protein